MKRTTTKKIFSTFYEDCESKQKAIADMRRKFPCYTLQQIGNEFGLSRERVRQILNSQGEETQSLRRVTPQQCQRCGDIIAKNRIHCDKCQYELHHVQVICDQCGKLFWRSVSSVLQYSFLSDNKRQHYFCDRKCFGRWTGRNRGFGAHPPTGKQNLFLKNLFVDKYRLVNVTENLGWKMILETLAPREILCFCSGRDPEKTRSTVKSSSIRYDCPVITSVIDGKLYLKRK